MSNHLDKCTTVSLKSFLFFNVTESWNLICIGIKEQESNKIQIRQPVLTCTKLRSRWDLLVSSFEFVVFNSFFSFSFASNILLSKTPWLVWSRSGYPPNFLGLSWSSYPVRSLNFLWIVPADLRWKRHPAYKLQCRNSSNKLENKCKTGSGKWPWVKTYHCFVHG